MIDYHMHTTYSDGKNSILEMAVKAKSLGYKEIAFTDHIREETDWFFNYREEIINLELSILTLVGIETKAINILGELDAKKEVIENSDLVLGAIHRLPKSRIPRDFYEEEEILKKKDRAYLDWLTTTIELIRNKDVDIIAHPFRVPYKYTMNLKDNDVEKIMINIVQHNKRIELNKRYIESNDPIIKYLTKNPQYITYLTYGSDAHSVEEM